MKKALLLFPLLWLAGCASLPKNVEVYMRSDVDTSRSKIIAFPLMLTDGKNLKPGNTSFSVPVVDAFAVKEWSSYLGGNRVVAVPKAALDKIPGAYDALNHIINGLDSTSAVEQTTQLTKVLQGVSAQFGDGALGFALVFEDKREYDSTKLLHLNMGIFDMKKLTWKWITKAVHPKSLIPVPYEVAVQKLIKDSMTMIVGGGKEGGGRGNSGGKREKKRRPGYSSGNNVLELDFGAHTAPSGTNYSDSAEYEALYHAGINYLYNFTPVFGLGAGYARLNTDFTNIQNSVSPTNISRWAQEDSQKVDSYKLLFRFTVLPEKRFNPEFTVGLGGFSIKDEAKILYTGSHYDSFSSSWIPDASQSWSGKSSASGYTGSAGIGLRYFLTRHFSLGLNGAYEYYRLQSTTPDSWYWYRFGGVAGFRF